MDVDLTREEEVDEVEATMEPCMSITIPSTEDGVSSASFSEATDEDDDHGSATPSRSIPTSVGSSSIITTRSLGSRSSFGDFPSNSNSIALSSSDKELVTLACTSLRQAPSDVQALDLSTTSRTLRRPLKSLHSLSDLTNLVQLNVSGNAIERVDGLQVLPHLQTLMMPRNHLKTLSAPLFALKRLTHLDLSGNFIAHLPRAFSSLTMLEVLNISGNNLKTLREVDALAPLGNLLSCSLAANPFCRLPTYKDYVICKLQSLERLDEVEISRVARDRAAKRFGSALFSHTARLQEADRAHEDEQHRLLEAQSALEAENLRLKGELQVKSKLLQNKSRAWSSATEQLLQLQQEVAMLNLDRRRAVSLPHNELSEAEHIALAIAARQKTTNLSHQRPHSAPRFPSPERSIEKRRGSFSELSHGQEVEDHEDDTVESCDAACMPMSPGFTETLRRCKNKIFVDASCSPLRVIPSVRIAKLPRQQVEDKTGSADEEDQDGEAERQGDYQDVSSPSQSWERQKIVPMTRPTTPPATSFATSRQKGERTPPRALSNGVPSVENAPRTAGRTSTAMNCGLEEDEPLDLNSSRSTRFPTFEDDTACPAYEETHYAALRTRSLSASALSSRARDLCNRTGAITYSSGSHSLPPSPANSPSKLREWYRKQNERQLMTPPPSPPRNSSSSHYKTRRSIVETSPLAPFVDTNILAQQIQALQSCKQSLLTEIRNEEHLLHVLKQESAQYTDQIDCLSVNIQACLDGDPSSIRFSFSPTNSPRSKSKKLREEETGRARLEILRNKLRFAEDKEKEIEMAMVRMTKRVLHADLNFVEGKDNIREKFSPEVSRSSDAPFDKEIFALTHKLQLVIVEKEEIHMQMSQLMARLRGHTTAELNLDEDGSEAGVCSKQVQSLAKSRQLVDELRTRHREVTDRIELKERRLSSLLAELKEVEAELKYISSLSESSTLSPRFQRERAASLEFLEAIRSQQGSEGLIRTFQASNTASATWNTAGRTVENLSTSSSTEDQISSPTSEQRIEGELLPANLQFNELLNPQMLEGIKADIYGKLSQNLASSRRSTDEISPNGDPKNLHQAIATALETRLQLGTNSALLTHRADVRADAPFENLDQNNCTQDENLSVGIVDTPLTDEVCCDRYDEFAPVETYYARKYVMAKARVSSFVQSVSNHEGNMNFTIPTNVLGAQRILKLCERLEAAEAKSKVDPVSKIEVDQQGNSRGSLKIMLLAARDLPTAHLRTKNLDPYVCLEVVYPSHALSPSSSANCSIGRVFRSQTKRKSIYPVWDEEFEFTPILALTGYLHVRVLNDRRLSREQLVGEARIPLPTLLHQKRVVEWFSLGLNVSPASTGSASSARNVVSKLCGGAVRLQLQLYFSSVERYKHVVDELVMRYVHDYNQLPPFIDAVGDYENGADESLPTEQPEQNSIETPLTTTDTGSVHGQRRQINVDSHSSPAELVTSLPCVLPVRSSSNKNQPVLTQLSPEKEKSLWETKPCAANERPKPVITDDKRRYFGFATAPTTERKKQSPALLTGGPRRSQTPNAQSKRIQKVSQHSSLRRQRVETPECFDEYSPYHPAFKNADMLERCNNEVKNGRITPRTSDVNRKTDLSIFKSPSLTRRPPSSGFPERYIGLDNQACERLKRIFGRMDSSSQQLG